MTDHIDSTHLRKNWLPRVDHLISSASFAKKRYRVQGMYVCATVLSQDEAEICELLATMPFFSVTQENLDWQAEGQLSDGRVYQHLLQMSAAGASRPPALATLFENVESSTVFPGGESDNSERFYCQSFRLSSLEVCNAPGDMSLGYHIGATAFKNLTHLRDSDDSDEKWSKWLLQYIVKHDVESPRIVWARDDKVISAVLWQVQLEILDTSSPRPSSSYSRSRRNPYGPFWQVHDSPGVEDASENHGSPEAKVYQGVRYRQNRKSWVAETRLPTKFKRNKVSFGDFKSRDQAARAVDAAFHYYGKQTQFNFANSPEILLTQPLPVELNDEMKLQLVKERAKWLAMTMAPIRHPSSTGSPSSVTAEMIPHPTSSCGHTAFPTISSESFKSSYGNDDEGAVESSTADLEFLTKTFTDDDDVEARLEDHVELNVTMIESSDLLYGKIIPENSFLLEEIFPSSENENLSSVDYPFELSASSPPSAFTFAPMQIDSYLWD